MRRRHEFLASLLSVLAVAAAGRTEELHTRFFRDVTLGSGVHFQHWSGEGDLKVRELSVPLVFICPVGRRLSLDVVTGTGSATLERGQSQSLSGLTNTKVRASYIVGEELALLTLGLSAPTGKTELDAGEEEVSGYLAQNALGFRTPSFGQGTDVSAGLAAARKLGGTVVGLGVSYLLKGEYTPWEGGGPYDPGEELSVTVGIDQRVLEGDGKLSLDVVYTLYGEDQLEGERVFQSGNKILVQTLATLKARGVDWRAHLINRSKGKNTRYGGAAALEYANGNQLEAGLSALRPLAGRLGLRGLADLKLYSDNELDWGEALVVGLGPGIRYRLSAKRYLDLTVRYARGTIDAASVSGLDLSASVWLGL